MHVLAEADVWCRPALSRADLEAYRAGIRLWIDEIKPIVIMTERRIVNERRQNTGRIDLLAVIEGDVTVVDWKSGSEGVGHGILLAGYESLIQADPDVCRAIREKTGAPPPTRLKRLNVYLPGNGLYQQRWRTDLHEHYLWQSALALVQWRHSVGYLKHVDPAVPIDDVPIDTDLPF